MKFIAACIALACVALSGAEESDLQVTVTRADLNRAAEDRSFCCPLAQLQCASQCAGQACTATCTGRCGFFGIVTCGPYTCSTIAATTCTAATTFPPRIA